MPFPLLYEINTRCWLRELSDKHRQRTTLANVPEADLAEWKRFGVTHIWLMGVWAGGPRSRAEALAGLALRRAYAEALPDWQEADIGGSPYAISDYRVPENLGGEEGLKQFRRDLQLHGLKLVLDFVPNHVGLDHAWVRERPELFVQKQAKAPETFLEATEAGPRWLAHGKDPNFAGWSDTAQLDYRRSDTRAAVTDLLLSVAGRCDGLRCDMAMLLLNDVFSKTWERFPSAGATPSPAEFWGSAISTVKQAHPEFLFMAEAYWGLEGRLHALGFDYTYDKALYDKLVAREPAAVQRHLLGQPPEMVRASAHFVENHDELRIAALLSPAEHRAAAQVILGLPGLRLLHEGQCSGARLRTPVQLLRRRAEPVQADTKQVYEQLLTVLAASAVGQGEGRLLAPRAAWAGNPTAGNFVVVRWQVKSPEFDLVVVNLAPHRSQCHVPLDLPNLAAHNWSMKDLLGREQYVRSGDDLQSQGLYLDLPPHGAQLFHFEPGQ